MVIASLIIIFLDAVRVSVGEPVSVVFVMALLTVISPEPDPAVPVFTVVIVMLVPALSAALIVATFMVTVFAELSGVYVDEILV